MQEILGFSVSHALITTGGSEEKIDVRLLGRFREKPRETLPLMRLLADILRSFEVKELGLIDIPHAVTILGISGQPHDNIL